MTFWKGSEESVKHVAYGIAYVAIVNSLIASKLIPPTFSLIFGLVNVVFVIVLLFHFQKTGFIYLAGWIFGVLLLIQGGTLGTGLIGPIDIIIDLIIPACFLGLKIYLLIQSHHTSY